MIITDYLTQTASIRRSAGVNAAAEQTYAAAETIAVRWFYENKMVRADEGREVLSTAHLSTREEISVADMVTDQQGREREVIEVRMNLDVSGVFSHYVAYLT